MINNNNINCEVCNNEEVIATVHILCITNVDIEEEIIVCDKCFKHEYNNLYTYDHCTNEYLSHMKLFHPIELSFNILKPSDKYHLQALDMINDHL